MAWTTPSNFTASSVVASSKLNDEVIANLAHLFAMLGSEAAWTSYTPTNSNVTVGNGTQTAYYFQMGKTVFFQYRLLFGSTTSFGGVVQIGVPVAAVRRQVVPAFMLDNGTRGYTGCAVIASSSAAPIHSESGSNGNVAAAAPFTWTTNDELIVEGIYEAS